MPVSTPHESLRNLNSQWDIIRDTILGEFQIKFRRDRYLPRPNANDTSKENQARYDAYITRAVFYNVVKRTLGGLVGQVFSREPIIEVPKSLERLQEDATGLGVSLTQLAKYAAGFTIGFGRTALFVDYPTTDGVITVAQRESGEFRPNVTVYDPKDVINWRWENLNGKKVLSLVVIQEKYIKADDGFLITYGNQWRVLRLVNGVYSQQIYKDANNGRPSSEAITPQDAEGQPFNEIPFTFIGAENNDPDPDQPPLYDLATMNVAHYRNSADYEEACYVTGQPTVWFSGLTEQWVKSVLGGKIQLGSWAAIPLPAGAAGGLIQVQQNTLPMEAMKHKEGQMVALGAKLVDPTAVQRTATEASIDQSYETSTLSSSADNVSDGFEKALKWAAKFEGEKTTEGSGDTAKELIKFELNTEFDLIKLSSNERSALIAEWQAEAISWGELRSNLRRGGIATQTDAEARQEIDDMRALLPIVGDPNNPNAVPANGNENAPAKANERQGPSNART